MRSIKKKAELLYQVTFSTKKFAYFAKWWYSVVVTMQTIFILPYILVCLVCHKKDAELSCLAKWCLSEKGWIALPYNVHEKEAGLFCKEILIRKRLNGLPIMVIRKMLNCLSNDIHFVTTNVGLSCFLIVQRKRLNYFSKWCWSERFWIALSSGINQEEAVLFSPSDVHHKDTELLAKWCLSKRGWIAAKWCS